MPAVEGDRGLNLLGSRLERCLLLLQFNKTLLQLSLNLWSWLVIEQPIISIQTQNIPWMDSFQSRFFQSGNGRYTKRTCQNRRVGSWPTPNSTYTHDKFW